MSSPFSSWGKRRRLSLISLDTDDSTPEQTTAAAPIPPSTTAPRSNPSNNASIGDARLLSSSVNSSTYREPIRSFIHGTVRDHTGNGPFLPMTPFPYLNGFSYRPVKLTSCLTFS